MVKAEHVGFDRPTQYQPSFYCSLTANSLRMTDDENNNVVSLSSQQKLLIFFSVPFSRWKNNLPRSTTLFEITIVKIVLGIWTKNNVPEVLNVHLNENNKKNLLFLEGFFSSSKKLTFEKENLIIFLLFKF